jgi:hypothetical protein
MCVGSPTAETLSSSHWRPDNEFETDTHMKRYSLAYYRAHGAMGGKIGGKRAAANMTAAQRKARATKASQAAAVARTKKKQTKAGKTER